ncbi:major histocompatibility complex class I-related gene protein-like [Carassius auratus]|uniref:Major histocompatibility complex class I-related gene protein-like n=1 Tax=Carassius auratus TaxID=7957 RepID=A0A6P6J5T5_CARAU|nr:major histocompatibility complex class I-related gene protein-like [Carassius auratus]
MTFIIFFIYITFVYSELHTFVTLYTEINGIAGIPEFSAVTTLDGRQIDYYDSEIKKLIPRQDWMKEFMSGDRFKEYAEIRERVQQTNKINITVLMQQLSQSRGVHTYQRFYGCGLGDSGALEGVDLHGYDGNDFISLDVKELRYITAVRKGVITTEKWNNDRAQLELLNEYYRHECVNWIKHFLMLRKVDLERRGTPVVSLLQRHPSSPVVCHATGFYPSGLTINWLKNREEHHEDVELGQLLPNEDGTFQKTSTLYITPEEWEKNQFVCEVKHMGRTYRKTADEIKSNTISVFLIVLISVVAGSLVIVAVIVKICTCWKHRVSVHEDETQAAVKRYKHTELMKESEVTEVIYTCFDTER